MAFRHNSARSGWSSDFSGQLNVGFDWVLSNRGVNRHFTYHGSARSAHYGTLGPRVVSYVLLIVLCMSLGPMYFVASERADPVSLPAASAKRKRRKENQPTNQPFCARMYSSRHLSRFLVDTPNPHAHSNHSFVHPSSHPTCTSSLFSAEPD